MAHTEIYQVWNPQNKLWVKMKNGRVLENSSFKFEGVPVFGKHKPSQSKDDKPAETTENSSDKSSKKAAEDDEDEKEDSGISAVFY